MLSQAPENEIARFASRVSRRLRPSLRWLESDHTPTTMHACSESDCQIGRLLKESPWPKQVSNES